MIFGLKNSNENTYKRARQILYIMMKIKKGALHRQLRIPQDKKIPKALIVKITKNEPGEVIKNPSKIGRAKYRVTEKMRKRAFFARSFM